MERLRTELWPPGGHNSFGEAKNNSDHPSPLKQLFGPIEIGSD
jgi:hypothetical protein